MCNPIDTLVLLKIRRPIRFRETYHCCEVSCHNRTKNEAFLNQKFYVAYICIFVCKVINIVSEWTPLRGVGSLIRKLAWPRCQEE